MRGPVPAPAASGKTLLWRSQPSGARFISWMLSSRGEITGSELPKNFIRLGLPIMPSTLLPWAIDGNPFHVPVYPGVRVDSCARSRPERGRFSMSFVLMTVPMLFEVVSITGAAAPTSTTSVTDPTLSVAEILVVFAVSTVTSISGRLETVLANCQLVLA